MSGYRSYVPWSKGSSSTSYSSKKESAASPKYESSYTRSRPEAKKIEDKSTASAMLGSKYGAYGSGYQRDSSVRDTSSSLSSRSELPTRYKSPLEKKDSLHPPVSYRPLTRTTSSRSRDPSPVDRDKTESSSSGSYNLNRLYPRPYTRSVSRERNEGSTIPKYTGRSSLTKDEIKYPLGRTSRDVSKEDLSSSSRYKSTTSASRTASGEDLSSSPKYITSRFLPKNTIEKSYTAYSRPSTSRTSEVSRKNRELLNVLSTQNEDRSRPVSRCSSITAEDIKERPKFEVPKVEVEEYQEMESVMVVTRSTSPNLASQSNIQRTRKVENAKLIEKLISRPLKRPVMLDKEIQSDRLDDTTKSSRFAGASRIAAPWSSYLDLKYSSPGEINQESDSSEKPQKNREPDSPKSVSRNNSSKSLSNSSSKSEIPSKTKSSDSTKSKLTPPKSFQNGDLKKQLPPQVPSKAFNPANTPNKDFRKSVLNMNPEGKQKKKSTKRSNSASSADSDGATSEATEVSENLSSCKSFPKSSSVSKLPQRASQEPTSESQRSRRSCTRSPSLASETSSAPTSSSEDDGKVKLMKPESKLKKMSVASSRTISSVDELSTDKSPKPPLSPRMKTEGPKTEAEAKSFLMRALAPVTNLFKSRPDSSEKSHWLDNSSDNISEIKTDSIHSHSNNLPEGIRPEEQPAPKRIFSSGENSWWFEESEPNSKNPLRKVIYRVDSDDKDRWLREAIGDQSGKQSLRSTESENMLKRVLSASETERRENWFKEAVSDESKYSTPSQHQINRRADSEVPEGPKTCVPDDSNNKSQGSGKYLLKVIRHVDSGEKAWWLEENAEVPEGVEVFPATCVAEDGSIKEGRIICPQSRKDDSNDKTWWLDDNQNVNDTKNDESVQPELFQKYKIRHIDSGERAWWLSSSENIPETTQNEAIRHQSSGEKLWWQDDESGNEFDCEVPLGDRASPEGLETPREDEARGRLSPYDNVHVARAKAKRPDNISLFISKHTNIDDILGGSSQLLSPLMSRIFTYQEKDKCDSEEQCQEIDAGQVRIHDSTPQRGVIQPTRIDIIGGFPPKTTSYGKLDDAALQLYKDGDYGSYLDLEASINEQQEEFEGFQSNKKNSIVLRTQLSVRVHTIIEKLLTSEGRELRRALFSLKQIFQEDKDLVHEFVQNDGLACLIKVGSEADQNYQNYILRALGQVMLYVDGMNGVMEHNQTIQWLYTLISSKFRLVVKTALKLLLVFVEYTDTNCMLLIKAVHTVDCTQGLLPWHNIMKLLKDFDSADTELLIYATTLINKCFNGVPDQDTYYDQTDALEEQGIEAIIQRYMSKPGTDLDLLQQFQIYEAVLQYEDGEDKGMPIRHLDENIRKTLRSRKNLVESSERRKSRRHSTGNTPVHSALNTNSRNNLQTNEEDDDESSSQSSEINNLSLNGGYKESNKAHDAGVTPALRRRRERAERQRSFMKEQQEGVALLRSPVTPSDENMENGNYTNGLQQRLTNGNNILNRNSSRKDLTPLMNAVNKIESEENSLTKQPWILSMMYGKTPHEEQTQENAEDVENANENDRNLLLQLKKENTVKDLTQKLSSQNIIHSPSDETKVNRIGDMSGLISKAKEGLAKSKSQANVVVKSPTGENIPKAVEVKKSENELRWEELVSSLNRPLNLCDMDFTDLVSEDENDILAPAAVMNGIPPPPPPLLNDIGPAPPPPPLSNRIIPPPVPNPPVFGINLQRVNKPTETKIPMKKTKKTVKLFWKEVRDDPISAVKLKSGFIWDELSPVTVDTQKLEHLFESRAKDLISKKQQELNKNKEIIVLDPKRSNAINIGMTKLPPPRSIKTAILKMDATIMNREGIEKLLTMLPTEEERTKIQEAQAANPDLPLGSAEQFLLTLASISELPARLKLWAFKLDFENTEREIAEPLMDLKQGLEVLRFNKTFRGILSTLLSIGNFLNGNEVKGFQIEYLSKVPEVKDTVHKHTLLHHLCHIVMEKFPDATDLYSEIGAITRASKIDFDELALNIQRLEADCKASWDHLKLIAKHDGSTMMKIKMSDFLADCAERIILLGIIHRRVLNRFHRFLLWLGIPLHQIADTKPNEFCRIVSEFALEYRTTRERVLQQLEKKANHRERNKTRGKMITETGKFRTKEDRADAELRQLLGSDISDVESMQGTLPWRRTRRDVNRSFMGQVNGNLTDGDDEILESLVKTATKGPSRTAPRERKRTRHADRKSLRRTLKNGLSEEEKKHLSAYIKGY